MYFRSIPVFSQCVTYGWYCGHHLRAFQCAVNIGDEVELYLLLNVLWCSGRAEKNWTKLLVTILVVWQLLSGFCLSHPMLYDCDIEEKVFFYYCVLSNDSTERQSSESFYTSSCGILSEWLRPGWLSRTLTTFDWPSRTLRAKARLSHSETTAPLHTGPFLKCRLLLAGSCHDTDLDFFGLFTKANVEKRAHIRFRSVQKATVNQ